MAGRRGSRRIDREAMIDSIIDAATTVIGSVGMDGLTMRKVAAECGVGVMTLYTYVASREELIAVVIDRYLTDIPVPDVEHLVWQEQVAGVFRVVNSAFEAHPVLSEITGRQALDSLAFFRGAELALRALKRAGLSDEDAVGALDALTSFVVGFSHRKAERRLRASQSAERLARIRALPPGDFPSIVQNAVLLLTWDSERHFEDGLRFVISGIEARAALVRTGSSRSERRVSS